MNTVGNTILVGLVLLLGNPQTAWSQKDKQAVRWKLAAGDRFTIELEQESGTRTQVDRREVEQSSRMKLTLQWDVESVDDQGTARIRQVISALRAEITLPETDGPQTVVYDSSAERHRGKARQLAKSFDRIVNKPVTVVMTGRGEIAEVEIPEETRESLREMPGSIEGRNVFSVDSVREMFQSAGTEFPETAVATGDTWKVTREFSIGSPHRFTRETIYTLQDKNRIGFRSTLTIDSNVAENENPDVEFHTWRIEDQNSSGTLTFDLEQGHVVDSQSSLMLQTITAYHSFAVVTTVQSSITMSVSKSD